MFTINQWKELNITAGITILVTGEYMLKNLKPVKCSFLMHNIWNFIFKMVIKSKFIGLPKDGHGQLKITYGNLFFGIFKREIKWI